MRKILLMISVFLVLAGCKGGSRNAEFPDIRLPLSSDLVTSYSYGTPKGDYLRVKENPDQGSKSLDMLWHGNIFEIFTKTGDKEMIDGQEDFWYMIRFEGIEGWVFGAEIELFEDLQKAEKWVKLTHE
ncbi:MAG: SH3 domain-containing protein [Spirochaetia bacterium]|nr:SH3 domain-containing protein [Spirochaetia bacterium]MBO7516491.1 SH3 domain-containing protein [Spirochaetia bacterium]MBP5739805.1 SH3 domain-containing protein [Spirochaetia bacterium]